jgi:hypothetical protein
VLDAAAEFGLTEASGIFVIDRSMLGEGDLALLRAAAVIDFTESPTKIPAPAPRKRLAFAPGRGAELPARTGDLSALAPRHMPPVSWSMPLAGRRFGCIAQDVGPGGMWYRNARLCRVTGFSMDPLGGSLEERICLSDDVHTMSLFKEEGEPCGMRFDLGCAVGKPLLFAPVVLPRLPVVPLPRRIFRIGKLPDGGFFVLCTRIFLQSVNGM